MTIDEIVRLEQPQPDKAPSWFEGWKAAVAAAAAVAVAIVGFSLVGGGDDVAAPSNLEIAEQFVFMLETGDVAGYEALLSPDTGEVLGEPFFEGASATWAYVSRFQVATGGTYTAECRETPTSPTVDVRCTMAESNLFREAAGLTPNRYDWTFGIEDGVITLVNFGGDLIMPAFDQIIDYDAWVQDNYPDEYSGLMGIPQFILDLSEGETGELLPMPLVDTDAQVARHAELTAEWFATLS